MKNKNGITLIALIITVILMLMLAGVVVTGIRDGGIFDYAAKAKKDTEKVQYMQALQAAIIESDSFENIKTKLQKNKIFANATLIENTENQMLFVKTRK